MRSRWIPALLAVSTSLFGQQWQPALPGYHYEFPRDHFSHPEYQTEWWYYTGNLHAPNGHKFGFELTFFRIGMHLAKSIAAETDTSWRPDEIYLAHFAVSDLSAGRFYHTERLNRTGPGLAGASAAMQDYWNGNWRVHWASMDQAVQQLQAVSDQFTLTLTLKPEKPVVINGQDGISKKGPEASEGSHYLSFTRLLATGSIETGGSRLKVDGLAWMDHEFFSEKRNGSLAGWDWFAIQLDGNEEVMLYRLRSKSGQISPFSSGTYVDAQGASHLLKSSDFQLQPGGEWKSPESGTRYPLAWSIQIPCLQLQLQEKTSLNNQELYSKSTLTPSYWEGAVTYEGTMHGRPARGAGYLEMTGYNQAVWFRER